VVIGFEALDQEGQRVFTEHTGALMRGVSCTGGGQGQEALPAVPSGPEADRPLWETTLPIDLLRPFLYDGCANIFFPIHTSRSFARQVGLPGIILQGTATLALAAREILNREAGKDPWKLQTFSGRFTGMVLPGTSIRVGLVAKNPRPEGTDLHFVVHNAEGQQAISKGYAFIRNE
jgi:acyl dehydratase